jgi:CRP/FNR family transcriptional regulator
VAEVTALGVPKPPDREAVFSSTSQACAGCQLYNCALCNGLDYESRARLAAIVDRIEVSAGEILAKEGEPSACVMVVIDGAVMSYKEMPPSRRQVTRFYFPGDPVALSGSAAHADVTIKAITPVVVCRIGWDALRRLCRGHPKLANRLLDLGGDEAAAAREHLLLLGRKSALEKVASFLVELACRTGCEGVVATEITLPMVQHDIADYLGLNAQTVSRMFTRLKTAGMVDMPKLGHVVLSDRRALSILAGMMVRPAPTYPSRSRAPSSRASKASARGHRSSEEPIVDLSSPTGLQGDQVNG